MKRDISDALDEGNLQEEVAGVRITHPQRMVFREMRISKLAVAQYYDRIAPVFVPGIAGRPLSLLRCPDGVGGQCFFQKHIHDALPGVEKVMRAHGKPSEPSDAPDANVTVQTIAGAMVLLQRGVLEFHTWGSRMPRLDRPDRLVIDLDPDDAVPWVQVIEAAQTTRALLDSVGIPSWLKTTGGKGLHVVAPIKPTQDWDVIKAFCHGIAARLEHDAPERFTAAAAKQKRKGRIFVDYLRNAEEATVVAAWSVRARDGAPVSMPLLWDELDAAVDVRGAHYNIVNSHVRMTSAAQRSWGTMATHAVALTEMQLATFQP